MILSSSNLTVVAHQTSGLGPFLFLLVHFTNHVNGKAKSLRQMRMGMDVSTLRTTKDAYDGALMLAALHWRSQQAGKQMLDAAGHTKVAHGPCMRALVIKGAS